MEEQNPQINIVTEGESEDGLNQRCQSKEISLDDWNRMFKKGKFKKEDMNMMVMNFLLRKGHLVAAKTFQKESGCRMESDDVDFLGTQPLVKHLHFKGNSIDTAISASVCAAGDSAAYQRSSVCGDDVVIVAAYRSSLWQSKSGGLKDTFRDDVLAPILMALIEKTNLNPAEVGDVVAGSVSQRASECRMAAFYAGFPETVPVTTVNRQCSSGLQAVADVAAAIKAGFYEIGIGSWLESMTYNPMAWEGSVNPKVITMPQARHCLLPTGGTSEHVAQKFSVTRQEQDQAAVESHRKEAAGKFKDEIISIRTKEQFADLAKLKPVFKKDGSTTAGTSSQVSDGAGAVLLMKRSLALKNGLPILGVFRTFAAVGVPPAIMGIGFAVAVPTAVKAASLQVDDTDLFEIDEVHSEIGSESERPHVVSVGVHSEDEHRHEHQDAIIDEPEDEHHVFNGFLEHVVVVDEPESKQETEPDDEPLIANGFLAHLYSDNDSENEQEDEPHAVTVNETNDEPQEDILSESELEDEPQGNSMNTEIKTVISVDEIECDFNGHNLLKKVGKQRFTKGLIDLANEKAIEDAPHRNLCGYNDESNPFGDPNLSRRFVWAKKIQQDVDKEKFENLKYIYSSRFNQETEKEREDEVKKIQKRRTGCGALEEASFN